jgi:catechol 2,3-dioxygenase-like lactoylglutathione lyase family enzyme
MSVSSVRHLGIVVRDAERSLGFYRDQLGLRVEVDQLERGEFIETLLGLPAVRVRTVKLSTADGGTLLELLQFDEAAASTASLGDLRRLGPTHAALTVDDLEALYRRLSGQGVRFLSPPLVSADGNARVAFCADPDGTMLELVEPTAR